MLVNMHRLIPLGLAAACVLLWTQPAQARPARHYKTLKGHKNFIINIAISANGKVAATVSQDGTARLWLLPSGRPAGVIKGDESENFGVVALGPAGKRVAVSVDSDVRLYTVGKRRKLTKTLDFKGHTKEINALAFDKDGSTLASAAGDGVRLWGVSTGKTFSKLADGKAATDVKFNPDTGAVVVVLADGIHFIGRSSLKATHKIAGAKLRRVGFSRDGKHVAAVSTDGKLRLFLAKGGAALWTKSKASDDTYPVFSPDGKIVITAFMGDKIMGHLTKDGSMKWFVKGDTGLSVMALRGRTMVTGGGETTVWLWRVR